jgi:hypothetical protein
MMFFIGVPGAYLNFQNREKSRESSALLRKPLGTHRLGACYWQVTYFLSIRLIANSTLEAMRTQGDDFHPFRASQRDM